MNGMSPPARKRSSACSIYISTSSFSFSDSPFKLNLFAKCRAITKDCAIFKHDPSFSTTSKTGNVPNKVFGELSENFTAGHSANESLTSSNFLLARTNKRRIVSPLP